MHYYVFEGVPTHRFEREKKDVKNFDRIRALCAIFDTNEIEHADVVFVKNLI